MSPTVGDVCMPNNPRMIRCKDKGACDACASSASQGKTLVHQSPGYSTPPERRMDTQILQPGLGCTQHRSRARSHRLSAYLSHQERPTRIGQPGIPDLVEIIGLICAGLLATQMARVW